MSSSIYMIKIDRPFQKDNRENHAHCVTQNFEDYAQCYRAHVYYHKETSVAENDFIKPTALYFESEPIQEHNMWNFDYCHPDISPKLDVKSAILTESLDSFSWGTWCHPSDELQPAAWQANPAKAINYFEQFAHQLHSARRPTLFSFLCPWAATTLRVPSVPHLRAPVFARHTRAWSRKCTYIDTFVAATCVTGHSTKVQSDFL